MSERPLLTALPIAFHPCRDCKELTLFISPDDAMPMCVSCWWLRYPPKENYDAQHDRRTGAALRRMPAQTRPGRHGHYLPTMR